MYTRLTHTNAHKLAVSVGGDMRRKCVVCHGVATISRLLTSDVSFAEYRLFYRALLQKRPIKAHKLAVSVGGVMWGSA